MISHQSEGGDHIAELIGKRKSMNATYIIEVYNTNTAFDLDLSEH
jgi:hypothetical protein